MNKEIIPEQLLIPPMLLQPFIENAIEHGFRGSKQQGEIIIQFDLEGNHLQVKITDNGIGIEQAQNQKYLYKEHRSMAMQITLERLKFLNKSKKEKLSFKIIDMASGEKKQSGTQIIFSIPV